VPPNRAQSAVPRTRSRTPRRPAPPGRTSRRWAWGESTSGRIARAPLCEGTRPRFRELVLGATPPGVPLRSTARSGSRRSSASRWQCPTAWPFPPSRCAPPAGAESERRRRGDAVRSVVAADGVAPNRRGGLRVRNCADANRVPCSAWGERLVTPPVHVDEQGGRADDARGGRDGGRRRRPVLTRLAGDRALHPIVDEVALRSGGRSRSRARTSRPGDDELTHVVLRWSLWCVTSGIRRQVPRPHCTDVRSRLLAWVPRARRPHRGRSV